ncbi:MAG: 30S ribosomal protein S12 methylthiotransferase RimO [Clostridia bacterium]|nr:30S ribosomal protein S12 methylthiotransferase RimO [Clostridia bacterium]
MDKKRIGVISLGCDKNRVDTEKMLSIICSEHTLVNDLSTAQIVIINTCAFLESARKEAIEEILAVNEFRENGCLEKIIVTGCLPQKFANDFFDDFTEIDALLGVSDYSKLLTVINRIYAGERVMEIGEPKNECIKGRVLTTKGYAYLKIADGCSNHCTYCLIPKIRGKFRSIKKSELIEEAKSLGQVNELILVAQDLTRYGEDLGDTSLCDLIRALSSLPNILGIRLMYCYPEGISDELIRELSSNAKLIRYIDIPLQHASDRILKLMNRKGSFNSYLSLIERLKRDVYGIAIRSTFITGFPTETEEDFNVLVDFIKKAKLFNAGFFAYSREEDTPAYKLSGQIKKGEKTKRLKKLYSVQKSVVKENLKSLIGKTFSVTVEGFDEDMLVYYGRAYFNAPDIDGKIYFFSSEPVIYNQNVNVKIIKAQGYDLYGEKQ